MIIGLENQFMVLLRVAILHSFTVFTKDLSLFSVFYIFFTFDILINDIKSLFIDYLGLCPKFMCLWGL